MKQLYRVFFVFVVSLGLVQSSGAQEPAKSDSFDIAGASLQYPYQPGKWKFRYSAGLLLVKPPKDLMEGNYQGPLVNLHGSFGLPWKVSLEADLSTIVISNQLALGPRLNLNYKNFGMKVGWDVAFAYGQLRQFGFDNRSKVWLHYPNLSIGYRFKDMAFTLKGELVFVSRVVQTSGENEIIGTRNFLNGFTGALYIEQRLWKNKVFVIGLKDNYEKFYWPVWMLFTTFNRYNHIPELSFTWII